MMGIVSKWLIINDLPPTDNNH